MIYFIHDTISRSIKIGHAIDVRKRLSTLQISTSNKLVLLGTIGGTKRIEQKVHALVARHCAPQPGETHSRPLCISGEWFDDRILSFVYDLMKSPKDYLDTDKKPAKPRPANSSDGLHRGSIVLVFDTGETYQEHFVLRASSPDRAMAALDLIAQARIPFGRDRSPTHTASAHSTPSNT